MSGDRYLFVVEAPVRFRGTRTTRKRYKTRCVCEFPGCDSVMPTRDSADFSDNFSHLSAEAIYLLHAVDKRDVHYFYSIWFSTEKVFPGREPLQNKNATYR